MNRKEYDKELEDIKKRIEKLETEEDARRAVETIGVDKVLKYYLEV